MTVYYILFSLWIVYTTFIWIMDVRENKKELNTATKKIIARSDENRIRQLEASMGIGIDINGLPGYTWSVQKKGSGLEVILVNADGENVRARVIDGSNTKIVRYEERRNMRYNGSPVQRVPKTVEQIEAEVPKVMASMVEDEMKAKRYRDGIENIIEKYNGKAVVQDEVTL